VDKGVEFIVFKCINAMDNPDQPKWVD